MSDCRCKLLLAPSLCRESFGRVVTEAQLNGIPVIATNRGGLSEAVGRGGITLDLPAACYEKPYNKVPNEVGLNKLIALITDVWDDPMRYQTLSARAKENAEQFAIDKSTNRLEAALHGGAQRLSGEQ